MPDSTGQSDQIMSAAGQSLATQRAGGTHRPAGSIGKGSAGLKSKHFTKKLIQLALGMVAIFVGAGIAGAVLNGIGFWGVMITVMVMILLFGTVLTRKIKIPKRPELGKGNPQRMVANTELWLESQKSALPAPAVAIVDQLGAQLDALGVQLQTMDESHPAMNEVRELVGEYIPETIDNYRKIPEHLRKEAHAGKTADERLTESLTKLSGEVDRVTRKLAEGALDDLAVKSRYLEYRYGGDELLEQASDMPDTGVPLPDFSATREKAPR